MFHTILSQLTLTKVEHMSWETNLSRQRMKGIGMAPQAGLRAMDMVWHELVDQQHARDVVIPPLRRNAEVAVRPTDLAGDYLPG